MKCGRTGVDTHEEIICQACSIFYYPNDTGTERPCKHFTKCQAWMKKVIEEDDEPRDLHSEYVRSKEGDQ